MVYFYIHKSPVNGQWYFSIRSFGNHKIIATSEGYHNKLDTLNTVNVIRKGAATAKIYDASTQQWAA